MKKLLILALLLTSQNAFCRFLGEMPKATKLTEEQVRASHSWRGDVANSDQRCFNNATGEEVPTEKAFLLCPKLAAYDSKYILEYPLDEEQNQLLHLAGGAIVSPEVRHQFVEARKQETLNVIARAYNNPRISSRAKAVYERLWKYLQPEKIEYPLPTEEFTYCIKNPNTYAFFDGRIIGFCSKSLRDGEGYVVQSLIHEVAHATYLDRQLNSDIECGALTAELSTMQHGGRSAWRSGYESRCKMYPGLTIN